MHKVAERSPKSWQPETYNHPWCHNYCALGVSHSARIWPRIARDGSPFACPMSSLLSPPSKECVPCSTTAQPRKHAHCGGIFSARHFNDDYLGRKFMALFEDDIYIVCLYVLSRHWAMWDFALLHILMCEYVNCLLRGLYHLSSNARPQWPDGRTGS